MADWEAYVGELLAEEPEARATWELLTDEERAALARWVGQGRRDHADRAEALVLVMRSGRGRLAEWTASMRRGLSRTAGTPPLTL